MPWNSCVTILRASGCNGFVTSLTSTAGAQAIGPARCSCGTEVPRISAHSKRKCDLADLFHLVYVFSSAEDPVKKVLAEHHFDAIYLENRKLGFISEDFRSLMFEIWKVKYLEMPRFREVIASIPPEVRLEHF